MTAIRIASNSPEVAAAFQRMPGVMMKSADRLIERGRLEMSREIKREAPKARSDLWRSIGGRRVSLARHLITVAAQHGVYVARGTGPGGLPSQEAMLDWIRVRAIQPRNPEDTVEDMARRMRFAIKKKGTPKNDFWGRGIANTRVRVLSLVRRGLSRKARQVLSGGAS